MSKSQLLKRYKLLRKTDPQRLLVLVIGSLMILYATIGLTRTYYESHSTLPISPKYYSITSSNLNPDESKPDPKSNYIVAPDQPKQITIPAIGVSGYIQRVGITKDNSIAAPSNINFGGWFSGSVAPGLVGLSIIDGHVSGKYTDGIFKNLGKAVIGQKIEIKYGDNSLKHFEIIEVKTLPENQAASYLQTKSPEILKQLNLITCAGRFNNQSQKFEDRVIVVAKNV